MRYPRDVRERIKERILTDPQTGCWLWTGCREKAGYGKIRIKTGARVVHRVAYEAFVGPVPGGLTLDHLCRVRHCCNPEHLEPVTLLENVRRGREATKTHCVHGHEYTSENTLRDRNGGRRCRTCVLAQSRDRKRAARAVVVSERIAAGLPANRPRPVQTHCKRGHEFTEENTRVNSEGRRICLTCSRATRRARYERDLAKARAAA